MAGLGLGLEHELMVADDPLKLQQVSIYTRKLRTGGRYIMKSGTQKSCPAIARQESQSLFVEQNIVWNWQVV